MMWQDQYITYDSSVGEFVCWDEHDEYITAFTTQDAARTFIYEYCKLRNNECMF